MKNLFELTNNGINYVVGERIGNLNLNDAKIIATKLGKIDKKTFKLNEAIIEKHSLLERIKGYRTNVNNLNEELLISRYQDIKIYGELNSHLELLKPI